MLDINTVIRKISDLGYMRVLVEGGSKLSASLLNEMAVMSGISSFILLSISKHDINNQWKCHLGTS